MEYYVLASGSKGNCTVVSDGETTIVIDAGTTDRHLKASFKEINIDHKSIDGVLITHTHSDHIGRINFFKQSKFYTPEFLGAAFRQKKLLGEDKFKINTLSITSIPLSHDKGLTLGYIIENSTSKLVYVTDTGYFKDSHLQEISNADYYIFESNHDPEMLMNTTRPFFLKQRIMAMDGHLCNVDAAEVLYKVVSDKTKEIVLAHISAEANDPKIALQVTSDKLQNSAIHVRVAKQFEIVSGGRNGKL